MKRLPYCIILLSGFLLFLAACTEEQDFSQVDDLQVTPTLASGLFYFESDEATINSEGALSVFYSQEVNFDAFNEQYVAERLIEGVITYEIDNTTSKELRLIIEFLDDAGRPLDAEIFTIEANSPETVVRDVPYGPGGKPIDILANTSSLRVSAINLSDGTSVSSADDPKIILRSGAQFVFRLK
ncbi:hypothetical protein PY092_16890 [Muricauda sp. 334s03]|uniref:Uncharacterized protein n=1 Tax=Flagellimonas yonaguniensis TaxID=3031325 RepID=A0ABT5Y313_9FLAO|nr:hypothetical protein [[Muricauda] yonaguniensis]MDF0717843.1 hypothetical protein [[Muricauda] yonaguniensis]